MHKNDKREDFISIIIPAYNESARIGPTLARINEYCGASFERFEIIVVNDGSSDDTAAVVSEAGRRIPAVRYASYEQNRGKGYAIRFGVAMSKGDLVLISDADLSTPIEEVEKLLVFHDAGYDIIIGSRAVEGSCVEVKQPFWRIFMGKVFNRIVRFLIMEDFRDTQCGFKLFAGTVARALFSTAVVDRFAYDVEILYLARKAGYKIREVPIRWINSPDSRVNPLKDSLQMLKDIIRMRLSRI
jgi:dolichyl-phosphate beta-glucosyltransferase